MRIVQAVPSILLALIPFAEVQAGGSTGSNGNAATGAQDFLTADPVNLKVLPVDISTSTLRRLMRGFKRDLGVECRYCHVENKDTGKLDFASDENPKKPIARAMIAMLDDINDRHLAQLGNDVRYATPVTCGTCHHGRANPPVWEPKT